ncbi:MAG: oligosaccharide flippase family protein [Pirellulales bacterium]|nr:oligosaccharide flippase family protein [Pirellulales bacterium]
MSKAHVYARNLAANWGGYGLNLLVMFFMSPFVVHSLGDVRYGVWSLLMSLTGYLGLVEAGTNAGLGRYVNVYLAKNDIPNVNGVLNTALAVFAVLGVVLLIFSGGLALILGVVFPTIPIDLRSQSQIVLLLVAANLWLAFLSAAFRQILTAHERFDICTAIDLAVLTISTTGTIVVLITGRGLVELAAVQVVSSTLGVACGYLLSKRIFPQLELNFRRASRWQLRQLLGFSIWAFINRVALRLLYTTDTVVIIIVLGPKQVTYYAIAGLLVIRSRDFIGKVTSIFGPQMIQDCARENLRDLRISFRRGSTLVMAFAIPLLVGLIVFGKEFLILWMGPTYAVSYPVLLILAMSQFPALPASITEHIYRGMHRVRLGAMVTLLQGIINLGLTLLFVLTFKMGIDGVAWGTFYPRVVFSIVAGVIALRWIHLEIWEFVRFTVLRWIAVTAAFFAVCEFVQALVPHQSWTVFFAKVISVMVIYAPLVWFLLLEHQDQQRIRDVVFKRVGLQTPTVTTDE